MVRDSTSENPIASSFRHDNSGSISLTLGDRDTAKILSTTAQALIGLGVIVSIVLGMFVDLIWVAPVIALAIYFGAKFVNNAFWSLLLYLAATFMVMLRTSDTGKVDPVGIVAGVVMLGISLVWVVKVRLIEWQPFSVDPLHLLLVLWFSWSILLGIGGMLFYNNTANDWIREILIQLPLVLVPLLYVRSILPNSKNEKYLFIIAAATWFIIIVANVVQYRNNIARAVYLYQAGRSTLDTSSSLLLFFSCITFAAIERKKAHLKYYVFFTSIAIASIIIGSYRTVWLSVILLLPVIYLISSRTERKGLRQFGWRLAAFITAAFTFAAIRWKIIRLLAMGLVLRFSSSAHVKTDLSLVNRYIEWRVLFQYLKASPFVGYGFGAHYMDYDWLMGFSSWAGYTHNGFLLVLFKSGLIGFGLVYTAYVLFLIRALKLARSTYLSERGRALMRVAFAITACLLITNMTLDTFAERFALFWLGMAWGAVIVYGREHDRLARIAVA